VENGREREMFTLVLGFPMRGRSRSESTETVTSGHVPQLGSTINTEGRNHGTWKVVHVGQTVSGGVMESTVYVYLEETD
jgi:hypothetical protein